MQKINRLIKLLNENNLNGYLTANSANVGYLTGIVDAEGWLLILTSARITYFTHPMYAQAVKKVPAIKPVILKRNFLEKIVKEVKKNKAKRIGFSKNNISLANYQKIKEKTGEQNIDFIAGNDLIQSLRTIKSKPEIKLIKKAASVSLEAFRYIEEISTPDSTEKSLSIEAERFLRLKSDNKVAFPPIVASGKNTVFVHHRPKEKKIGNFFLIDLGARHYRYCADLTRVFFLGKMPSLLKKAYETIKKAQQEAIKKIKDGKKASEIDKIARNIIDKNGFGKYFLHGLGHGVGLEVHEPPYLRPGQDRILKEGMILTVEPAIYYKNQFGLRIEDMVVVKPKRCEVII